MLKGRNLWILTGTNFSTPESIQIGAMAGVWILVSNRMAKCVVEFTPVNMRTSILKVKLEKFRVNFIQMYAQSKQEEYETFIIELEHTLDQLPGCENIVMLGGFRAHVGDETAK